MVIREGLRRIVKAISVIAWACLTIAMVISVGKLFSSEYFLFWLPLIIGAIIFTILQGIAWIIAGFSGNPKESDGLVRWADIRHRRKEREAPQTQRPVLVGVAGWLSWLTICLLIIGPLALAGSTLRDIQDTENLYPRLVSAEFWEHFKILYWTITAIACAISIVAGYRLRNIIEPRSVAFAKLALWIIGPGFVISSIAIAYWSFGKDGGAAVLNASLKSIMSTIINALVWTLYLKWSRRVRNTYFHRLNAPDGEPRLVVDRREPTL